MSMLEHSLHGYKHCALTLNQNKLVRLLDLQLQQSDSSFRKNVFKLCLNNHK